MTPRSLFMGRGHAPCRPAARQAAAWSSLALAGLLAACGSTPRTPEPAAPPQARAEAETEADTDPQRRAFEQRQTERAQRAAAQGQWAEAVQAWEVLVLLNPGDTRLQDRLSQARARRTLAVDERWTLAEALRRRGELDAAAQRYLELLALDPTHPGAAEALRGIERERNRRSFVGKFSRLTLTRRSTTAGDMQPEGADAPRPPGSSSDLLEHSTLLARQGDLDAAIGMLRDAAAVRSDPAHRALLVELYVAKGESLRQRQPEAARVAAEAALALDRKHAGALALMRALPPKARDKAPVQPAGAASAAGAAGRPASAPR